MELPTPTTDVNQAFEDLERTGVAIVSAAVGPAKVAEVRAELDRTAAEERRSGSAVLEDGSAADGKYAPGPNQRVLGLLDKGRVFADLASHDVPLSITRRAFGSSYGYPPDVVEAFGFAELRLSSVTANIANRGGLAMTLHADQGFVPGTDYPIVVNALWPLVDLTSTNGATEVVPGSHLADPVEMVMAPPPPIPVTAAAGSVILFDGRTWHRTGVNRSDTARPVVLVNYCRPWVRPFDDDVAGNPQNPLAVNPWFIYDRTVADRAGGVAEEGPVPTGS